MMYRKKSEIPLSLIFTITIAIAGILLLLFYIGHNTNLIKRFTCSTIYNNIIQQNRETPPECKESLSLAKGYVTLRSGSLSRFQTGRADEIMFLNISSNYDSKQYIKLPRHLILKSAAITVGLPRQYISKFESKKTREIMIIPNNRPTINKKTGDLPVDSVINSARMEIYGTKYPSKANLVFAIDSSASMSNEWTTICYILSDLNSSLNNLGINFTFATFGLADGTTVGNCLSGKITIPDMKTVMPLPVVDTDVLPAKKSPAPRQDDYKEAWALGAAWLARNFNWSYDTDVKRILIPIGDSDPTGGGPTQFKGKIWLDDAQFTGTEDQAVQLALDSAINPPENHIYVIPIYGDESSPLERFNMGAPECTDPTNNSTQYDNCRKILSWMNYLADLTGATSSGANVTGFRDKNQLFSTIMNIIITPYPKRIEVRVNREADPVWTFPRELNDSNSPQVVSTTGFVKKIQNCVRNQNNCPNGKCKCNIGITSDDGTVILDKLRIEYTEDPRLQYMVFSQDLRFPLTDVTPENPSIKLDITEAIEKAVDKCSSTERNCIIPIEIKGEKVGLARISDLSITYEYSSLEEDLLNDILDCWSSSNNGQNRDNVLCKEIIIQDSFNYTYPITEEMITDIIMERNLCGIIGNNDIAGKDIDCGEDDNIKFAEDLYNKKNILVEYDSENKQVVVS